MSYSRFIDKEVRISKSLITPGNLYRISSYSYADGEARAQTGPNSSLIFVFGIHEKKLNCLKLNDVSTDIFKNWLKTLLKSDLKSEDIDSMKKLEDIIIESDMQGNKLFESKIKGKSIYNTNPRPYRTYNIVGLNYIQEVKLKSDFLKSLL
jgi:hypothetical protein